MHDEHISPIKTPKQLAIVLVLAFLVPIALFLLLSQLVTGVRREDTGATDAQVLSRIKPVGEVTLAGATGARASMSGEQVFQAVCKTCHEPGIAGAPKVGDKAAWAGPIKKGYETLVQHALNGFQEAGKVMPPRGGNPDLSDIEVESALVYMANRSGANYKEPAATTAAAAAPAAAPPAAAAPAAAPQAVAAPAASGAATAAAAAPAAAGAASAAAAATPPAAAAAPAAKVGASLDLQSGQAMMQKYGCAACHAIDKPVVGPAYSQVAAKYRGDKSAATKLEQKVKAGGSGVWGAVPMPPNATVPDADIKALVSWILTLGK
ncbi:MAG TPA: c-type cytochrome [Casimicrobiaceae bacterium]|nr:c-type cytochrome [Casimicrobiaceae bacterium]